MEEAILGTARSTGCCEDVNPMSLGAQLERQSTGVLFDTRHLMGRVTMGNLEHAQGTRHLASV